MRSNYSYRFFPFAPGIKWKLKNNCIIPEVTVASFDNRLKNKDITVCAYGGLLESFTSFAILEMIDHFIPSAKRYWCGNKEYYNLLYINGLAKPYTGSINSYTLKRYPLPLFFDKGDNGYFNCLNNYIDIISYTLTKKYKDRRPAIQQIVEKGLFKWNSRFIPSLRNLDICVELLNKYKGLSNFSTDKPFIILSPEKTGYSNHNVKCLKWNCSQVKSFISMMYNTGIQIVVLSKKNIYFGQAVITLPINLEIITYLILKGGYLIVRDIDLLLYGLLISDISLISDIHPIIFNLRKNAKFLGKNNDIYIKKNLMPIDIWRYILEG